MDIVGWSVKRRAAKKKGKPLMNIPCEEKNKTPNYHKSGEVNVRRSTNWKKYWAIKRGPARIKCGKNVLTGELQTTGRKKI